MSDGLENLDSGEMSDSARKIPRASNPYGPGVVPLTVLILIGIALIVQSGIASVGPPDIRLLLPGIMLTTMAVIFLFGAVVCWRGFEKRFGPGALLGYWEIEGGDWQEHLETEKKKLKKLALIGGVGFPGIVLTVMLVLAQSDGDLEGVMPVALIVCGGISLVMMGVVLIRWYSLRGNQGCVWLAKRGILVNRVPFFIDGFGMRTLSRELIREEGKHTLSIRYQVQVRHTVVDKEIVVPVPKNQLERVEAVVEEWNREC